MIAIRFLLQNLDHFKSRFFLLLVAGALDGAAIFSVPLLIAVFLQAPFQTESVGPLVGLIIGAICSSIFLQFWIRKKGEALAGELANHLRTKLFCSLESLQLQDLTSYHSGYLLSLATQVGEGVGGLASTVVWLVGHAGVAITLFIICTAQQSAEVAALNVVFLVLFLLVSSYLARRISDLSAVENCARAVVVERFSDCMANIQTVKRMGIRDFALSTIERATETHNQSIGSLQTFHARRWAVLHALLYASFVCTVFVLLRGVANAWIASSVMILFVATFSQVRNYVERLSELIKRCMELRVFIEAYSAIAPHQDKVFLQPSCRSWQSLICRDARFCYPGGAGEISAPFFELQPSDIVVISGESGQGKSTFLAILAGLLNPQQGTCFLNGEAYGKCPAGMPANLIALVSQETDLFDTSIRENICLGVAHADESLQSLLGELGLGSWISQLPEGLDSRVGEKGLKVSAGQKQRLTIARAILMDRPILFLDEPTAHLDIDTEESVVACIKKHLVGKTAVIVSHRDIFSSIATRHMRIVNRVLEQIRG